jgi:hypothetical protein
MASTRTVTASKNPCNGLYTDTLNSQHSNGIYFNTLLEFTNIIKASTNIVTLMASTRTVTASKNPFNGPYKDTLALNSQHGLYNTRMISTSMPFWNLQTL